MAKAAKKAPSKTEILSNIATATDLPKKKVPARPPQKNWMNPFTKQLEDRPAKPASVKVKVRALRALKDMVA